jgi:hypothetical protein
MRPNLDVVFDTIAHCLLHDQRIACMEATCNIGMIDNGQQFFIRSADIIPVLTMVRYYPDVPVVAYSFS